MNSLPVKRACELTDNGGQFVTPRAHSRRAFLVRAEIGLACVLVVEQAGIEFTIARVFIVA